MGSLSEGLIPLAGDYQGQMEPRNYTCGVALLEPVTHTGSLELWEEAVQPWMASFVLGHHESS